MASDRPVSNLGMGEQPQGDNREALMRLAMRGSPEAFIEMLRYYEKPLLAPMRLPPGRASILPPGLPAPFLENFYQPPGLEAPAPKKKLTPSAPSRQPDPIG